MQRIGTGGVGWGCLDMHAHLYRLLAMQYKCQFERPMIGKYPWVNAQNSLII
jgi:hypothetical protein